MTENLEKEIKQLVFTRGQLKSKLTKFINFYEKIQPLVNAEKVSELENRLITFTEIINKFDTIQSQLEYIDEDEMENTERENFEDKYYDIITKAKNLIKAFYLSSYESQGIAQQGLPQQIPSNSKQSSVKLPTLELSKFNGNMENWPQFRDLFVTLVHNDQGIDNVKKFYYLSSCLVGEAQKVISSIKVTNDNYQIAWDLLVKRFENKNIIIKNHINAILDLPHVSKSNYTLRNLTDDFQTKYRALEVLGEPVDQWNSILIQIIVRKLDIHTESLWEEHLMTNKVAVPAISDLMIFLADRCLLYESKESRVSSKPGFSKMSSNRENNYKKYSRHSYEQISSSNFSADTNINQNIKCLHCKEPHKLFGCKKLLSQPVASRISIVKKLKICLNCLRPNHNVNECLSQGCKICHKKHNTILHLDNTINKNNSANVLTVDSENISENYSGSEHNISATCTLQHSTLNYSANVDNQVILPTAVLFIQNGSGEWLKCRALPDSGSQSNFITKNLVEKLRIDMMNISVPVTGVGGSNAFVQKRIITNIKSVKTEFEAKLSFLILNKITNFLPTYSFEKIKINIPEGLILADENFHKSSEIELLLGAEIFYSLLSSEQIKLGPNLPILQKTVLGWVVSGPLFNNQTPTKITCHLNSIQVNSIESQLEKFWKIEEYTEKKHLSYEESECEQLFCNTVSRDKENHFVVQLPIKSNLNFGNTLQNAVKRLYSMEKRFRKDSEFKNQYVCFMNEYEKLGHMSKIEISDKSFVDSNVFYLPHHGVINQASLTTALRVVFDGSCKGDNGISLNDILMVGPAIQQDLFNILIRFRQHNYVLTADIAKMYRQVRIAEHQRDFQRIVWRSDHNKAIEHYRLNTVTYGTSSASFLAIRCLHQIAMENQQSNPRVSAVIMHDFYVDDLITGTRTREEAFSLKSEMYDLLKQNGFELRKWLSNDSKVSQSSGHSPMDEYAILDQDSSKILGLTWLAKADILKYNMSPGDIILKYPSKRAILSVISKLFDPLGLIAPIIIQAKILIQKLWVTKLGWDDPLPADIEQNWVDFSKYLSELNELQIPRQVVTKNINRIEIHCFCDASLSAYGACIYIKSFSSNAPPQVRLLCAKTRVAPIKTITLPRLELCGAVLAVRLYERIIKALRLDVASVYFWTDSTIVLAWLSSTPNTWKIFVANRVAEILSISERKQWRYVPSKENSADILSRGVTAADLKLNKLWWFGPPWLQQESNFWPAQMSMVHEIPEKRNAKICTNIVHESSSLFLKYSKLRKLVRVVALCYRFVHNCRNTKKLVGEINLEENNRAMNTLLGLSQNESFQVEVHCFKNSIALPKKSHIRSLNPFIDSNGLIRVGGRLSKANLDYDRKFPIILHPKHPLTKLIILNEHHRNLHAGTQTILATLRQQYWPLRGRMTVRNIIKACVTCFRVKPASLVQKMADLPLDRVTPNRPFYISGVDIAGPFIIKDSKFRNRRLIKAYLCLFVCFTTRAVHLEPMTDMTTNTFLNALKRFVSRRGLCKVIYSDNGSNFVGANRELREAFEILTNLQKKNVCSEFFLQNQIHWNFIPSRSPHHGGLWEAAIKQAKLLIKKLLNNIFPTFEELITIFSQIEAILNSRPLTPMSQDPNDFSFLTPGHFLIGDSLLSIPQTELTSLPTNRLKQFQCLQQVAQNFWKRWSHEYLSLLQQRQKWTTAHPDVVTPGSMVLLKDDNLPSLQWKMGRIKDIHRSHDGLIRTVTVRTPNGETRRAVQKLCLLPIEA